MTATEPLSYGQQLLAQRLLAEHCLSLDMVQEIFQQYQALQQQKQEQEQEQEQDTRRANGEETLNDWIKAINGQMKPAFGLEIKAINVPTFTTSSSSKEDDSDDDDDEDENDNHEATARRRSSSTAQMRRYYAIVNSFPDELVTKGFEKSFTSSEHSFLRHVLQVLATNTNNNTTTNDDDTPSLAALINVRNDMPESSRVTLGQAEAVLQTMMQELWILPKYADDAANSNKNQKKKRKRNTGGRRSSTGHKMPMQLGPRAYMELSLYLVEECGMEKDELPQILTFG